MRLSALGLVLLCSACSGSPDATLADEAGGFHYSASAASGRPVLTGSLDLQFPDDSTVTGNWAITWVPGADTTLQVGPQVGTGPLVGIRRGDTLLIELNPLFADNNVGLVAVPTHTGWRGEWVWVTFTGPRTRGPFTVSRH